MYITDSMRHKNIAVLKLNKLTLMDTHVKTQALVRFIIIRIIPVRVQYKFAKPCPGPAGGTCTNHPVFDGSQPDILS